MSKVVTSALQHPSSGSANITLNADGSIALPAGVGGILGSNVVSATKTDTFVTSSDSFVTVTDLEATITPSSATSKVLVIAHITHAHTNGVGNWGAFKVTRGGTDVYVGDTSGDRTPASFGGRVDGGSYWQSLLSSSIIFVDSPATTSATTYQVEAKRIDGVDS